MEGRALLVTLGAAWLLAVLGTGFHNDLVPSLGSVAGTDLVVQAQPDRASPGTPAPLLLASLGRAGGEAVGSKTRRLLDQRR